MEQNAFDVVVKEIAGAMGISADTLRPETKLTEIGMDSLEALQFLLVLEDATGIQLDEKDLKRFTTVQSIVDLINERAMNAAA